MESLFPKLICDRIEAYLYHWYLQRWFKKINRCHRTIERFDWGRDNHTENINLILSQIDKNYVYKHYYQQKMIKYKIYQPSIADLLRRKIFRSYIENKGDIVDTILHYF